VRLRAAVGTVVAAALAAGCLNDRETTSPFLDQPGSYRITLQGYRKQYRRFKLPTIYPFLVRQLSPETPRVGVFTPDGRSAVVAGPGWTITTDPWTGRSTRTEDPKLYVWDVGRGTLRARLKGHGAPIVAMDLGGDGSVLVTAARDGSVRLWDLQRLEALQSLPRAWEEERGVAALAISADGGRVAAASVGTALQVWDTSTGDAVARFEASGSGMPTLALSPDGEQLAVARRSSIHIVELSSEQSRELLRLNEEGVRALAFLPGPRLAVASGRTVRVVDLETGEERQRFYHVFPTSGGILHHLVASKDGHQLLSVANSEAVVWDLRSGGVVAEADALPPGIAFASIGEPGTGRTLWALRDNSWDVHAFPFAMEAPRPSDIEEWRFDALRGDVTQLDFSPDGRLLLAGVSGERHDRTLRVLDLEERKMVHSRRGPTLAAFAADGSVIVAHGLNPRRIGRWTPEADDPNIRPIFEPETNTIFRRLLPRTGGLLATGHRREEGTRYFGELWDAEAGRTLLSRLRSKVDKVTRDGKLALVVGSKTVEIVDVETGAVEKTIETYLPGVADISRDGRTLVVGDAQGPRVSTFDVATGELQCELEAHHDGVSDVRMLPGGGRAVSGGRDGTARVWDLTSCAELQRFDRHRSRVFSLAVSADGRWLATGSRDEVCLWRLPGDDVSRPHSANIRE
jgi:WD40 repeat protein